MKSSSSVHPDLCAAQSLVYGPGGYKCSVPVQEAESIEYGAYTFDLNEKHVLFRVAKTTPTKVGQFVTLWKRIEYGPIQPFDPSDPIDLVVVSVRHHSHFGQFIFSKAVLVQRGVFAKEGKGGKRAIRVYPPWDKTTSPQATKTQKWQIEYFLAIPPDGSVDLDRCRRLYSF